MVKKYSVLYFVVLGIFVACIVGPAVASSSKKLKTLGHGFTGVFAGLVQPRHQDKNDTKFVSTMSGGKNFYSTPKIKSFSTKTP